MAPATAGAIFLVSSFGGCAAFGSSPRRGNSDRRCGVRCSGVRWKTDEIQVSVELASASSQRITVGLPLTAIPRTLLYLRHHLFCNTIS